jgi:4-hydroxybenzoate polyprenyltransferase
MAPVFHLTRVTTAFAIVANTWFVILWSRAERAFESPSGRLATAPLWILLAAGAAIALGLFTFGTSLNDILDLKRDRTLRPDRPLAAGQVPIDLALALVIGTIVTAIVGANGLWHQRCAAHPGPRRGDFIFNATGRFIPRSAWFSWDSSTRGTCSFRTWN